MIQCDFFGVWWYITSNTTHRKDVAMGHISLTVLFAAGLACCTRELPAPVGPPDEPSAPALVINEFMADNNGDSILNEYGVASDWIELYNRGDEAIALRGYYLSDDSTDLRVYSLPDTSIQPGGYLLVWADGEPQNGVLHAPFKLSAFDGDEIILTIGRTGIVDRIQFFPHNNNPVARVPGESYGRTVDGGDTWDQQRTPSPGAPNSGGRGHV
jgi:hypothetical protein